MNNELIIYTHYGHLKFDKNQFDRIQNRMFGVKPTGGFWASRQNAQYGWKDWNRSEGYADCNENNKIDFTLKPNSRILEIHCVKDVDDMVEKYHVDLPDNIGHITMFGSLSDLPRTIDFEKISEDYDAIECFISDDRDLFYKLYTWDCDSILVLNPNVVEPILEKEQSIADAILGNEVILCSDSCKEPISYCRNFNDER